VHSRTRVKACRARPRHRQRKRPNRRSTADSQ
jgi:hypothetical protein